MVKINGVPIYEPTNVATGSYGKLKTKLIRAACQKWLVERGAAGRDNGFSRFNGRARRKIDLATDEHGFSQMGPDSEEE